MVSKKIQEILELHPFVGSYSTDGKGRNLTLDEKSRVCIPTDLRLIIQERRWIVDYMLLDMALESSKGKTHSELELMIQQKKAVVDSEPDKSLVYVSSGEECGVPYILVTDVPLQLGIDPKQISAKVMDKQGRITLGEFARRTGLEKEVVFFGNIDHIRVYSAANWERYSAK